MAVRAGTNRIVSAQLDPPERAICTSRTSGSVLLTNCREAELQPLTIQGVFAEERMVRKDREDFLIRGFRGNETAEAAALSEFHSSMPEDADAYLSNFTSSLDVSDVPFLMAVLRGMQWYRLFGDGARLS